MIEQIIKWIEQIIKLLMCKIGITMGHQRSRIHRFENNLRSLNIDDHKEKLIEYLNSNESGVSIEDGVITEQNIIVCKKKTDNGQQDCQVCQIGDDCINLKPNNKKFIEYQVVCDNCCLFE